MSKIKKRSNRFRARLKENFETGDFSHEKVFRNYLRKKGKEEKSTIAEMWEQYLNFTRLEF